MATFVQANVTTTVTGSPTTMSAIFNNTMNAGDTLVVFVWVNGVDVVTAISDSGRTGGGSNYYTSVPLAGGTNASIGLYAFACLKCNAASAGAVTVTVTLNSTVSTGWMMISEYSGAGYLDSYTFLGTSVANPSTTLTTVAANTTIVAAAAGDNTSSTPTNGTGFTTRQAAKDSGTWSYILEDETVSSAGAYTVAATGAGASLSSIVAVAISSTPPQGTNAPGSGFNPTKLAAGGPILWLDNYFGITQAAGSVSKWHDCSGYAFDFTSGVSPTYSATGGGWGYQLHGSPQITFNGTTQYMTGPLITNQNQNWTIFIGISTTNTTQVNAWIFSIGYTTGWGFDYASSGGQNRGILEVGVGASQFGEQNANTWEAWTAYDTAGTQSAQVNGVNAPPNINLTLSAGNTGCMVAAYNGGASNFGAFSVTKIIVFPRTLSAAEITQINKFIMEAQPTPIDAVFMGMT
jgi:hypothetical protein